ncbi:SulP family inorganic anion transporter [Actinobacillus equuli subsp. haemolyticus]|uniref:SulP family inorganic anion transporter n=1 Tax=Actinobacillus equuli TaxID=718 RepID=UPI0024423F04|nr:SulP family inorganic anion transporter [Actinobacillus equuli]WGE63379.1 SulP family inorganic anion transporter [Actinobacillus equuli subsp. haemolyticus]
MIPERNKERLFKQNFASGLVVFLVALPLCLGIALASGAPPLSGIISGIIGGIVIGFLSTSHISVAGPAAGLVAIVLAAINQLGSFELFLCAGIVAGAIQLSLGFLRAGSITNYIPVAVIEGMLAGIGILIIFSQLPYALGNKQVFAELTQHHLNIHLGALLIALISLFIMLAWDSSPRLKQLKMLPSALVAVIISIGINQLFIATSSHLAIPANQLVQLPIAQNWQEMRHLVRLPDFSGFGSSVVWVTGATMAIVASIETLLSIEAADRLDSKRRITDTNQELRAQGVGNIVSSVLGGLPITAVIVRSSANANAGATHKLSSIIHGILLFVCVLAIPSILNQIPLATLSAVLILVGYKLARPTIFKHFWHKGIYQFIPFVATAAAVVAFDLLKGVGLGLVISIIFLLQGNMKRAYYLSREELEDASYIKMQLSEEVSFLNKAAIKKTLKNIRPNSKVIIDASRTSYIASDVLELIEDFANITARENHIRVYLKGFKSDYNNQEIDHASHVKVEHGSRI